MDEETVLKQSALRSNIRPGVWLSRILLQRGRAGLIHQVVKLIASGGVSLFRYLMHAGLFNGRGVIILSKHNRATFGTVDMRRASTLVTLRRLNMVKHLEMFVTSLSRVLPPGTNFIGCFSPENNDSIVAERTGGEHPLPDWHFHYGRTDRHSLNRSKVSELLERNGLRLISMTERKGVTYFHSRKIPGLPVMSA